MTENTITDADRLGIGRLLAADRRRREARLEFGRKLAELRLLERYDDHRGHRYGDYGGGQRVGELSRRRNELERLRLRAELGIGALAADPARRELVEAFYRVGLPKLRRLEREAARQAEYLGAGRRTRATGTSLKCWRLVMAELELRVDNPTR